MISSLELDVKERKTVCFTNHQPWFTCTINRIVIYWFSSITLHFGSLTIFQRFFICCSCLWEVLISQFKFERLINCCTLRMLASRRAVGTKDLWVCLVSSLSTMFALHPFLSFHTTAIQFDMLVGSNVLIYWLIYWLLSGLCSPLFFEAPQRRGPPVGGEYCNSSRNKRAIRLGMINLLLFSISFVELCAN